MKKIKLTLILLTVVVSILVIAKLVTSSQVNVKIGYLPISSHLPIYIADKEGMFDKEKINVKLIEYKNSSTLISAVINGEIDLAYECATDAVFNALSRDKESFKIYQIALSKQNESLNSLIVPANSKEASIEDLLANFYKSKKRLIVGHFPGPTARAFVETIVNEVAGSKKPDIEIISINPGQPQLDNLSAQKIDLLFTYEPFVSQIIDKKIGRELEIGPVEKYLIDPWPGGVGIMSTRFVNKTPKTAKEVMIAIYNAFDFLENNNDKARYYLSQFSNLPDSVAKKVRFTSHVKLNTDFDHLLLERYMERLLIWKIIDQRIKLDEIYFKKFD